jgi:hypothetical protein
MTAAQPARPLQRTPRKASADLNYARPIRTHHCFVPNSAQ